MRDLSIVIPYRSSTSDRERIFAWTHARYESLLPDAELIMGEMTSIDEFFCRAEAINNGVCRATRQFLLIADADAVAFPTALEGACRILASGGSARRVFPYDNYHHLTRPCTDALLNHPSGCDPRTAVHLEVSASYPNSTSGLVVLSVDDFWLSGGFDEKVRGWGPEDQMWDIAFETLVGSSARIAGVDLYHLFHDIQTGQRADQPHYADADQLWDRYKTAARNPQAIREVQRG